MVRAVSRRESAVEAIGLTFADPVTPTSTQRTATTTRSPASKAPAITTEVRPFKVAIGDDVLVDLRNRVQATRWPDKETVADQSQGVQLAKMPCWTSIDSVETIDATSLLNAAGHLKLDRHPVQAAWHDRALHHRVVEDVEGGCHWRARCTRCHQARLGRWNERRCHRGVTCRSTGSQP